MFCHHEFKALYQKRDGQYLTNRRPSHLWRPPSLKMNKNVTFWQLFWRFGVHETVNSLNYAYIGSKVKMPTLVFKKNNNTVVLLTKILYTTKMSLIKLCKRNWNIEDVILELLPVFLVGRREL